MIDFLQIYLPNKTIFSVIFFLILITLTQASIHEYSNGVFYPRSNSFFFHGGSEGLYASVVNVTSPSHEGKSFIRFESVTFRRTKESASKHHSMQKNTGLVEAIIVEIQDRDKIGGSYFNSEDICCTPALSKEKYCQTGEVIIHQNPDNTKWPHRIQTFFDGTSEEADMPTTTIFVEKTDVKKTLSRLLLLVVSMGYGVVRPTLGGISSKVALLGVVYFIASEALELVEHLGNVNDFSGKTRLVLVLPVALLDATFIVWIFSSLSKTLEKLQIRRSVAKLDLYRKFTNTLAASVLLSVAWIGYELYFNASDPLSELWERAWIIPAFWNVLSFILLAIICILWAPSRNPTRFAYSEETGDDFDEEGISLTAAGDMKERKLDHVFGLGEDLEEDKRE